jgi:phosphoglycerol transferase
MIDPVWVYAILWLLSWFTFSLLIIKRYGLLGRIVLVPLTLLLSFLSMLLASSIYMQGSGFNEQFLFHLDRETADIALRQYGAFFIGSLCLIAVAGFFPLWLKVGNIIKSMTWPSLLFVFLLSLLFFPPFHSVGSFWYQLREKLNDQNEVEVIINSVEKMPLTAPAKNLIFLYLESIEQLYFDQSLYPNLLPNLQELANKNHSFTNLHQLPGTEWTMAGIVASQCGVPINIRSVFHGEANTALAAMKYPLPGYVCLADILKAYDYETVMYKGAPLKFSGAENFLAYHGYTEFKGREQWLKEFSQSEMTGWGIYDERLFKLAYERIKQLSESEKNYMFSMVTLDTHHPTGHASKSCPKYRLSSDSMLQALHCTDFLVGEFISKLKKENLLDNTVLVLLSDHLAMRNTQWDVLKSHRDDRRLSFTILDNDGSSASDTPATHFDVAPTVLSYLNIPGFESLGAGRSIRNGQKGLWFEDMDNAWKIASAANYGGDGVNVKNGFAYDFEIEALVIDNIKYRVTNQGYELDQNTFFGIIFDDNGDFYNMISTKEESFFNRYKDKFIVVVTKNSAVARFVDDSVMEDRVYILYGIPEKGMQLHQVKWSYVVTEQDLERYFKNNDVGRVLDAGLM